MYARGCRPSSRSYATIAKLIGRHGTKCGIINSTNVPLSYDGADLVRLRRATYARQPGDSGGPVTLGSSDAEGSHVHYKFVNGITYAYYSQVWEMESASGYSVYFGN
jgi:hypothetical protein